MREHDSATPATTREPKFNTFEVWKEYQKIAMHFNDLLMRLRSQSLAAVAAFAALAGVILRNDVNPSLRWEALAGVFAALLLFWIAIWILDFAYYNRLLIGAVDALIDLEKQTTAGNETSELILSTKIEAAVADWNSPRSGRLGREKAKWFFYGLVFLTLVAGLAFSILAIE